MTPTLNQRVDFTDASLVSLASHCLPRVASTRQENRTLSFPCQRNIPSWLPTALSTRLPFKPAFLGVLSRLWFEAPSTVVAGSGADFQATASASPVHYKPAVYIDRLSGNVFRAR